MKPFLLEAVGLLLGFDDPMWFLQIATSNVTSWKTSCFVAGDLAALPLAHYKQDTEALFVNTICFVCVEDLTNHPYEMMFWRSKSPRSCCVSRL